MFAKICEKKTHIVDQLLIWVYLMASVSLDIPRACIQAVTAWTSENISIVNSLRPLSINYIVYISDLTYFVWMPVSQKRFHNRICFLVVWSDEQGGLSCLRYFYIFFYLYPYFSLYFYISFLIFETFDK